MVGEEEIEIIRRVTPTKQILDFALMPDPISTEEAFRKAVELVCGDEKLPLVFPRIPDYFKARNKGLATNSELRDSELSMPKILYNSDTYIDHPKLRGPMEELILGYEKERVKHGLSKKTIFGNGWSQTFLKRIHDIQNLPLSKSEMVIDFDRDDRPPKPPLKGIKIA